MMEQTGAGASLRREQGNESMKKLKAVTRIAALFLKECYPGDLPAHAATQGLDREFRAWFDLRIHDPDVVQLLHEAELDAFAEELEKCLHHTGQRLLLDYARKSRWHVDAGMKPSRRRASKFAAADKLRVSLVPPEK
jgi:hypothetical protein